MDTDRIAHVLRWEQDGVIRRRQLLELGASDADLARMVRRRELTRVHRGVFVDHTGPLSDGQRGWAAVLVHWPAALARTWAAPGVPRDAVVEVAIEHPRTVPVVSGVRAVRIAAFDRRVDLRARPPADRPADAVLDLMSTDRRPDRMFAVLTQAAGTREVWPELLRDALNDRTRIAGRHEIAEMICDLELGANSVLERGWLGVSRRHGLPTGEWQVRAAVGGRVVVRDLVHHSAGLVIELDGFRWYGTARTRDRDADRDLSAAVDGLMTVRLTYGQVFRDGCVTAARLSELLRRRGWDGSLRRCQGCP